MGANRYWFSLLIFLLCLLLSNILVFGSNLEISSEIAGQIQALISQQWKQFQTDFPNLPGGIALHILTPLGETFFSTDIEQVIGSSHIFRAASITKSFTGAAIMLLQQEGLLNIYDSVTDNIPNSTESYLPESLAFDIPHKEEITIIQLLQHWGGVFDLLNSPIPSHVQAPYAGMNYIDYVLADHPEHTFTLEEIIGVQAKHNLYYAAPGTEFHYSNIGYSLLAVIIERVSGETYADFISRRFLRELDLNDSVLPSLGWDQRIPEPAVASFNYQEGEVFFADINNMSYEVGNGNLISSPRDLVRWAKLLYSGSAGIDNEGVQVMMAVHPLTESYGYGLGTEWIKGLGYGHSGAINGFLSLLMYDPATEVAALIYCNVLNFDAYIRQMLMLRSVLHQALTLVLAEL